MAVPTGKLKFAYETIANMESKINELKVKIKELEQPDMFWCVDDSDYGMDSAESLIEQFIDKDSTGQIFELEVACMLPSIKVKVLPDNSDGSLNLEYLSK